MRSAGPILVVSELISELPWGSDNLPIVVTHPYGQFSPITRAELMSDHLSLEIDADPDSDTFRDLLTAVMGLLNELAPDRTRLTAALRTRIIALADEIEEAL